MDAFERWECEEQLRHVERVLGPDYLSDPRSGNDAAPEQASWVDWLAIVVGLGAMAVGGLLCTNELWGRPEHLWKFGLAVVAIGQAALAVGLWQPSKTKQPTSDTTAAETGSRQPRTIRRIESDSPSPAPAGAARAARPTAPRQTGQTPA